MAKVFMVYSLLAAMLLATGCLGPKDVGLYSLSKGALSGSTCNNRLANYVDPVGTILMKSARPATATRVLRDTAGLRTTDTSGDQRMYRNGTCSYESVDSAENAGGSLTDPVMERNHVRCWTGMSRHETYGYYVNCTPHFDDDDNRCGHYVPEVYPYPERVYPGFSGSGFTAMRWILYDELVSDGPYRLKRTEYWGNRTPIHQGCGGGDEDAAGNGYVDFIEIW